ncbi:hypothetical protein [Nocardia sp. NRRL WC-3656]|uniref:hypothetical protein n=1 Tax=Nocardia sp. NRRL WC-3656 TaxID=1463824 RepID=UPI0004C4478C|nr:hypothetical protein [Nocardia sp. NRRL WC-3656]
MTNNQQQSQKLDVFDLFALGVLQGIGFVFVAAWWAVLFPMISIPVGIAVAAWVLVSWVLGVVVVGVFIAGMVLWRLRSPQTFERWITSRARHRAVSWWRYRRHWARLAIACHLGVRNIDGTMRAPRLIGITTSSSVDRLRVRMLEGQCPVDYAERTSRIAHTFGALDCRAIIVGPGTVELVLRHKDSLAETVTLPRIGGTEQRKDAA